jgi:hypothetical protein
MSMHFDLRTLSEIAGRTVATEVAVDRLREIARAAFAETLEAITADTLARDPERFHAAARVVQAAIDASRDLNSRH